MEEVLNLIDPLGSAEMNSDLTVDWTDDEITAALFQI
jgi:dihydroxyacetone kinase DhaKLM complex PTS-EIIA-like component DhaM